MKRGVSQCATRISDTQRCGARTSGGVCQCPAMENGKCFKHGGASPGARPGVRNGNYRDGYWTREAIEVRRFLRLLLDGLNMEVKS
jgi:hypothetical protein